jgi:hypothetical protein
VRSKNEISEGVKSYIFKFHKHGEKRFEDFGIQDARGCKEFCSLGRVGFSAVRHGCMGIFRNYL